MMQRNVGPVEQVARLMAAAVAGGAAVQAQQPWLRTILGTVAAAGLVTGLTRYCPVNRALGVNRCGPQQAHAGRPEPVSATEGMTGILASPRPAVSPAADVFGRPELRPAPVR